MSDTHSFGLQAGATALQDLLVRLRDKGDADLEAHCVGHPERDAEDARDYRGLAQMVQAGIEEGLHHQDPGHRQGYLRALTDLLCMQADGCSPDETWDPILSTAAAFSDKLDKPKRSPLRSYADAMSQRIRATDEPPEAWAVIREAIADHLEAYLRRKVVEVDREMAVMLATSLRQVGAKELPTLWTPLPRRRGESPDTAGAAACIATALEYIAFCSARQALDSSPVKTVAQAFGVHTRTVMRWQGREGLPDLRVESAIDDADVFPSMRAGLHIAARHYAKFGGHSAAAIKSRNAKA